MHEDAYRKTYLDVHVVRGSAARTYIDRLRQTSKKRTGRDKDIVRRLRET